ncbi:MULTISPECIES: DUF3078 domain-containing protein [Robiginitalea]|uniref:DUF3078 domain-containing protein n=1 Tax=Robiginitalea biformata (strain ATCC BAA-864 / DSM 15991 / KCTC 12146 / HTCC2501) TaxID=313596 RepID=A4CHE7_ROBBH|nr:MULTISPECIES: DUF3078 domain-containing protein [Robiginitalea]EAR16355.1 hypothetical protein RB2501_05635 [Robiginitalea biformata HTCC2501]MDC6353379.1 DUF3078 domain-containing protein [Robiginitalea sp. PM2]MDC6373456.1 DUF3078 domain-containing protein [Robiginitalea sp. SP8]
MSNIGAKTNLVATACLLLSTLAFGQDTIPRTIDSIPTDTLVIRTNQYPIRIIPRGVNLTNPVITFNETKPLMRRKKRFRVPSFWEKKNEFDLQLSEVAFVNWNAGGDNAVSAIGKLYFERNYKFRYFQWDNDLELRFGWNAQEGRKWRKTDDAIRLSSTIGYRRDTISNWYYSVKMNFNTQFADGFKYPDRSKPISRFMAPGYLFLGAGTSYIPEGKDFNLYISPLTFKGTFVLDQTLANNGAFGVEKAVLDNNGNVLEPGSNLFAELGFLVTHKWELPITDNVILNHNLSLYTDYLRVFGNVDVDWQVKFNFKVNEFIQATLLTHLIYDDDILFDRVEADDGTVIDPGSPRTQFRQQLGIGINYKF